MELFANGALCLLLRLSVSRSTKPPGSLVSGPHCNYKKAKEHYNNRQNCHYHKLCAAMFDNFMQTDADKSRCTTCFKQQSTEGCQGKSKSSFPHHQTIEFCGRQEISLRGHRDAGAFSVNETDCNDGVFKAALRLRVEAADKQTSDLFKGSPQRFIFKLESAKSNYIFDG